MNDDEKKIIPHMLSDSSKLREMSPSLFRGGLPDALAKLSRIVESHGAQARPPKMPGDAKMPEEYWQLQRQDAERKRLRKVADRKALAQEIAAALREKAPQDAPALTESPSKTRAYTLERAESLAAVLDEIEARALEVNHPFDRAQWPGTKAEFRAFLRWKDANLVYRLPADDDRLSNELRPHGVKFGRPGRDKKKGLRFYRTLFPDYPA